MGRLGLNGYLTIAFDLELSWNSTITSKELTGLIMNGSLLDIVYDFTEDELLEAEQYVKNDLKAVMEQSIRRARDLTRDQIPEDDISGLFYLKPSGTELVLNCWKTGPLCKVLREASDVPQVKQSS